MSVLVAFYLAAGLCGFGFIAIFLTWKFRYVIWSGYFRAEIVCEDGDIKILTMRLKLSDKEFTCKIKGILDTYHIIDDRVYRIGRFRIPKSYYNAHQAEPIDMQGLRKQSEVSATRYRELARNTVTSQLLTAFSENPMREAAIMFIGVIIGLGGTLLLGIYMNSRFEEVLNHLGG